MNEDFWSEIFIPIQVNTGLDEEQYRKSLCENKDTIIKFLTFNLYPDLEDDNIKEIKREILNLYTKKISVLISKYEIYEHDLDARSGEAVFELMQIIATAELTDNLDEKKKCYGYALKLAYFLKHMMHILLIDSYKRRIKYYKKTLKNFNRNGIYVSERQKFDDIIKEKYKSSMIHHKNSMNEYKKYIEQDKRTNVVSIKYNLIESDIGFENVISPLEEVIELYEENYPKIINNGYKFSLGRRLLYKGLDVLSICFLIYGFLKFLDNLR